MNDDSRLDCSDYPQGTDAGFWGRSCARLVQKNKAQQVLIEQLVEALKIARDEMHFRPFWDGNAWERPAMKVVLLAIAAAMKQEIK